MNLQSLLGNIRKKYLAGATCRHELRHKPRLRVETLEDRAVPATLPAPIVDPTTITAIDGGGIDQVDDVENLNGFSPVVVADPTNPLQLVKVNMRYTNAAKTETSLAISVSNNGGASWQTPAGFNYFNTFLNGQVLPFGFVSDLGTDPKASDPQTPIFVPYTNVGTPSVAFDRFQNFYVVHTETNADFTSGRLVMRKFTLNGTPRALDLNPFQAGTQPTKVLYQWVDSDEVHNPSVAVDVNLASFQDPDVAGAQGLQADPLQAASQTGAASTWPDQVRVFVAWNTVMIAPEFPPANFNPNVIKVMVSDDGGQRFAPPVMLNSDGYDGLALTLPTSNPNMNNYTQPKMVFLPGRTGQTAHAGRLVTTYSDFGGTVSLISDSHAFTATNTPHTIEAANSTSTNIGDAIDGGDVPDFPTITNYPLVVPASEVGAGKVTAIHNIAVTLALEHDALNQLRVELVSPTGVAYVLWQNGVDGDNNDLERGIEGTQLGVLKGFQIGTTFRDNAIRRITDGTADEPFSGNYRPENFINMNAAFGGLTSAQISGTWNIRITDFLNSGNVNVPRAIRSATLRIGQNHRANMDDEIITGAAPAVGTPSGTNYPTKPAFSPGDGIGPGVSMAVDNSLGAFSAYQNRVYFAFCDGGSVGVRYSDNGGATWSNTTSLGQGFQPSITVDAATGTLVVAFYSTRFDAAGVRSAMMVATAINQPVFGSTGSIEFSTPTYVNASEQYFDQIRTKTMDFEPVPSHPAVTSLGIHGYGNSTGLVANNGRISLLYTGNMNKVGTQIRTQSMRIAGGARAIAGDLGPILGRAQVTELGQSGSVLTVGPTIFFNDDQAADGHLMFDGFVVEFDRIVDPSTINVTDITLKFHAPTADPALGGEDISNQILSIQRLDTYRDAISGRDIGTKRFLVNLVPQNRVGSYSYSVGPAISDRIREFGSTYVSAGAAQNFNAAGLPIPIIDAITPNIFNTDSVITIPANAFADPLAVVGDVQVQIDVSHPDVSTLSVQLISPTGLVINLVNLGDAGQGADFSNVTFDDAATVSLANDVPPYTSFAAYAPADPFSQLFANNYAGNWTLRVIDHEQTVVGTLNSWRLTITPVKLSALGLISGNTRDQDADGTTGELVQDTFAVPDPVNGVPFTLPYKPGSLPVTVSGPYVVATRVPNQSVTTDNVVVDAKVSAIDVQFDRTIDTSTFTTADILRITGPLGNIPLNNLTITPISAPITAVAVSVLPAGTNSSAYRISFTEQKLAGNYHIQFSSKIADLNGNLIDTDNDAGVAQMTGGEIGTPLQTETYVKSFPTATTIPANSTILVPLQINDAYLIRQVLATLTINHPNIRQLTGRLIAPDGTSVLLFTNTPLSGSTANMLGTTFDDGAAFPIQTGSSPFSGSYTPIQPLAQLNGRGTLGTWQLEIQNNGSSVGSVSQFDLKVSGNVIGTGLGEDSADQFPATFRIHISGGGTQVGRANWSPLGPAGRTTEDTAGRVGAIAVDPTDPSGNTVYVAGASGGVWRTTNFLTRDVNGPAWVPLTDFGPANAINVSSIALYPSADLNPAKTMVVVGTGNEPLNRLQEEETLNREQLRFDGVGLLISEDAGKTWEVIDSTNNFDTTTNNYRPVFDPDPITGTDRRDHLFVGAVVNKIVVEEKLDVVSNRPIIYAAISEGTATAAAAGLWRSTDGGRTWQRIRAGNANDFVLAAGSVRLNSFGRPTIGYLALEGQGMFKSVLLNTAAPVFTPMAGGVGRPTINSGGINVDAPPELPNGNKSRIVLAVPSYFPGDPLANSYYQRWVYAAVSETDGQFDGLYVSKDSGDNWTRILTRPAVPDPNGFLTFFGGRHSLSLAVDPTDPNFVYIGSDALFRVDATFSNDPQNFSMYQHSNADGGLIRSDTRGAVNAVNRNPATGVFGGLVAFDPNTGAGSFTPNDLNFPVQQSPRDKWNHLNLLRDPYQPFLTDTALTVLNTSNFFNDGQDVRTISPSIARVGGGPGEFGKGDTFNWVSSLVTVLDPLTGKGRVLWGGDEGVSTFVNDPNGRLNEVVGFDQRNVNLTRPNSNGFVPYIVSNEERNLQVEGIRNGNLQIARLYSGDVQPSLLAANIAQSLLVAAARRMGDAPVSDADILETGNLVWSDVGRTGRANYVATDSTGSGVVYILRRINELPLALDVRTNFFQVQQQGGAPISRTNGLFQSNADAQGNGQWDNSVRNFAVNPVDPNGLLIGSNAGRLFRSVDMGLFWDVIAEPADLDGSYTRALAFGAPLRETSALNDHIYVGTRNGNIFVKTGGEEAPTVPTNWTNISNGLAGSGEILKIIPNPTRGTAANPAPGRFELYAVAENGVYYMANWTLPGATWLNITGNIPAIQHLAFNDLNWSTPVVRGGNGTPEYMSIAVDWRAAQAVTNPTKPTIYAGTDGGVFQGVWIDANTVSWRRYTGAPDGASQDGGGLPEVKVTDLDLALGNIDPNTGKFSAVGSSDMLIATTLGRGQWGIAVGKPLGLSGPRIVDADPIDPQFAPPSFIEVEFDTFMAASSFTVDDVVIKGPSGQIIPATAVIDVTVPPPGQLNLHNRYRITFNPLTSDGGYTFTIGSDITDGGGTLMNQDADTINGEAVEDQFTFKLFVGVTDMADYVKDVYDEFLGRLPTTTEYTSSKVKAMETARFTGLQTVIKELLISHNNREARQRLVERLFNIPGGAIGEIGNLLPTYLLLGSERDAFVTGLQNGTKTPERIIIDILTKPEYFTAAGGTVAGFLNKIYADLFNGLNITFNKLPAATQTSQTNQAATPTGRLNLVKSLVNGATVKYDHDLNSTTALLSTNFRTHFVNLAYAKYLPSYTPTASDLSSAKSLMAKVPVANALQGSEWVIWKIMTSKPYFESKIQGGLLPDAGLRTNRSWVTAVVLDRIYRNATTVEVDTFSQKVLDRFKTQRQSFMTSVLYGNAYRLKEINEYFQLIHNRLPNSSEQTSALNALKNGSLFPNLMAGRFATSEFYNTNAPIIIGSPASPNTWAKAVYNRLGLTIDAAKEAALAQQAGTVAKRQAAVLALLKSPEYRTKFINDTFQALLNRAPSAPEHDAYQNFLKTKRWELVYADICAQGLADTVPATGATKNLPREFWEVAN